MFVALQIACLTLVGVRMSDLRLSCCKLFLNVFIVLSVFPSFLARCSVLFINIVISLSGACGAGETRVEQTDLPAHLGHFVNHHRFGILIIDYSFI